MEEFLSLADIKTQLYPPELRLSYRLSQSEYTKRQGRIIDLFERLPVYIEERTDEITKNLSGREKRGVLIGFYSDLLQVGINFLKSNHPTIYVAAGDIACCLQSIAPTFSPKNTNNLWSIVHAWNQNFLSTRSDEIKNAEQRIELCRNDETLGDYDRAHTTWYNCAFDLFLTSFRQASRIPVARLMQVNDQPSIHDKVVQDFICLSETDLSDFSTIFTSCRRFCLSPQLYPAAHHLCHRIYTEVCNQAEPVLENLSHSDKGFAWEQAYLRFQFAANAVIFLSDIPTMREETTQRFNNYCALMLDLDEIKSTELMEQLKETLKTLSNSKLETNIIRLVGLVDDMENWSSKIRAASLAFTAKHLVDIPLKPTMAPYSPENRSKIISALKSQLGGIDRRPKKMSLH